MQSLSLRRRIGIALAALTVTAAGFAHTATFTAGEPGAVLTPTGGAETIIDLVQGQEHLLWSSLAGNVTLIETIGWPSTDGTHALGGALQLERPVDGSAGIVDFGERPMSMTFTTG